MSWIHRISVGLLLIMGVLLLTSYLTLIPTSLACTFSMLGQFFLTHLFLENPILRNLQKP